MTTGNSHDTWDDWYRGIDRLKTAREQSKQERQITCPKYIPQKELEDLMCISTEQRF